MRIKIIDANVKSWYSEFIGDTYEAYEAGNGFMAYSNDGKSIGYVRKENAEVIGEEQPQPTESLAEAYPKYYKDVSGVDSVDVYEVHRLFAIDDPSGAIHHASKKLLLSGVRTGGKSKYDDVREARDTLNRWLAMNERKAGR